MSGCSDIRARVQMSRHLSRDISWIPKFLGIYRDLSSIFTFAKKLGHLSKRLSRLTRTGQAPARFACLSPVYMLFRQPLSS
eukprot:830927-Prymnesium_polylepis.1